jgi:hypothetical protein
MMNKIQNHVMSCRLSQFVLAMSTGLSLMRALASGIMYSRFINISFLPIHCPTPADLIRICYRHSWNQLDRPAAVSDVAVAGQWRWTWHRIIGRIGLYLYIEHASLDGYVQGGVTAGISIEGIPYVEIPTRPATGPGVHIPYYVQ